MDEFFISMCYSNYVLYYLYSWRSLRIPGNIYQNDRGSYQCKKANINVQAIHVNQHTLTTHMHGKEILHKQTSKNFVATACGQGVFYTYAWVLIFFFVYLFWLYVSWLSRLNSFFMPLNHLISVKKISKQ